jgi:retron-type reverse transcriptase
MGLLSWLSRLFAPKPPPLPPRVKVPPLPPSANANRPAPSPVAPKAAPAPQKLRLDAAQFTALSDAEVRKQAKGQPLLRNPWFGRRDLIPPASDERTLLIDRAMVAHGLLTPEELVRIHEVGDRMAELRPDLAQAHATAADAVKLDEEARKALRAQRKAEAAARRQQRAEDITRRRHHDIVFLGRGVSGGLADRRANVEKLQAAQLPVLATPADVAQALGLTIPRLRWLAFHSEASAVTHYVRFTVPKKSGGVRELAAPHHDLATAQRWILINILEHLPLHDAAHGFVRTRGTMSNAVPHVRRATVNNLDLKDFFPSITFPRVKGIFQGLGYSPAVATVLALLCTECPRRKVDYAGRTLHVATGPRALPQGACTSPALSNLLARRLDARLAGLARKLDFTYTRYADDLTFSGDAAAAAKTGYLLTRIRHLIADERLTVNEQKTRVQRPGAQQTVTGIVVNQRPNVPRTTVRRLRAILHDARHHGLDAANREGRENFVDWLGGMIAYVSMVNPGRGRELREEFDRVTG